MIRIGTQPCMRPQQIRRRACECFLKRTEKKSRPPKTCQHETTMRARSPNIHAASLDAASTKECYHKPQKREAGSAGSWQLEAGNVSIAHAPSLVQPDAAGADRRRRLQRRAGRRAARGSTRSMSTGRAGPVARASGARSAHDFVWRHRSQPYDLTVYQLGNSSHHDYLWPYLFRYPGLAVLHDAHLHHARAAALLRTRRASDYRAEFAANHPGATRDLAELAVAGFDNHLYYSWPMTRLVVAASRLIAVHSTDRRARVEGTSCRTRRSRYDPTWARHARSGRTGARGATTGVAARMVSAVTSMLFGVFGGLTPEKRIPQILGALAGDPRLRARRAPAARRSRRRATTTHRRHRGRGLGTASRSPAISRPTTS